MENIGLIKVSIIVPVHNEAAILEHSISSLMTQLAAIDIIKPFELVLSENGSSDSTISKAASLQERYAPRIKLESISEAGYGLGLRKGIQSAAGEIIVIFNADYWDCEFMIKALEAMNNYDLIIGTKNSPESNDNRPLLRRLLTKSFNALLTVLFSYSGTDTHGLKVMRATLAKTAIEECVTHREVFDTEFVLRMHKKNIRIMEIPVPVEETRPTRLSLLKRVSPTIFDLYKIKKSFAKES